MKIKNNKINKEFVNQKIREYLSFDIEKLKYLRIYFVKSKNTGNNILTQITFSLSIIAIVVATNQTFFLKITQFKTYFELGLFLIFLTSMLYFIYMITIMPKKYNEELLDLEILEYCIDLKERFPELNYVELLDKFQYASGKGRNN